LPASGYERAKSRYEDLAEWFGRAESVCAQYSPHIYPQGSFRLGTVVKPIAGDGEYDLDLGCRLRVGINKSTHTQRQLKMLVRHDLEAYRVARGIEEELEEKHRCWRLAYADQLSFHMDAVPSIPEGMPERMLVEKAMTQAGVEDQLAKSVANLSGAITDNRSPNYNALSPDWRVSNSEGYALWFESRMRLAASLLQERALIEKALSVDKLPAYRWQSPLQRTVQILKRHRDALFETNPDSQPISIIITTLAARAYQGEGSVADALRQVLSRMAGFIGAASPRVPNPVNPAEDFADRWADPSCRHLKLEDHFRWWLRRAQEDLDALAKDGDADGVVRRLNESFRAPVTSKDLLRSVSAAGAGSLLRPAAAPSNLGFPPKPVVPNKPAGFAHGV
jgi:hypothetical protein